MIFDAALAGNRTSASRVAGENSTTEPPVLAGYRVFNLWISKLSLSRRTSLFSISTARKIHGLDKSQILNSCRCD